MEDLCIEHGRYQVQPDTISFNTVMDALARSRERGKERRAEALLQRMDDLDDTIMMLRSSNEIDSSLDEDEDASATRDEYVSCKPNLVVSDKKVSNCDEENGKFKLTNSTNFRLVLTSSSYCSLFFQSFNTVLSCWARSRERGAARRATAILRHMEQRFESNNTDIQPDTASYNSVINAWAGSKEKNSIDIVEKIVRRVERTYDEGLKQAAESEKDDNYLVKPGTLMYNSVINCYAKSKLHDASERAVSVLERMKEICKEGGREDCCPDVITYTSVIDTLAKKGTMEASERAYSLLEELESAYSQTGNRILKPNVRTYTSVRRIVWCWKCLDCPFVPSSNKHFCAVTCSDRQFKPLDVVGRSQTEPWQLLNEWRIYIEMVTLK